MKMMIAVIGDQNNQPVSQALIQAGFRATRVSSTGAFLRRGSSTLIMGVENEKVDDAIRVVGDACSPAADDRQKRAAIFVLDVEQFLHL